MASGAGLNVIGPQGGVPLLYCTPASTAVTLPAYGANGANSYTPGVGFLNPNVANPVLGNDSGVFMTEGKGFTKWTFQLLGPGAFTAGYSISILGTVDPSLIATVNLMTQPAGAPSNLAGNRTVLPATSWGLLPGPSEQTGTGAMANPLVSGTNVWFQSNLPVVAVRAVLTAITTPTQPVYVVAMAVP